MPVRLEIKFIRLSESLYQFLMSGPRADPDFLKNHLRNLKVKEAALKKLRAEAYDMQSKTLPMVNKYSHVKSRLFQTTDFQPFAENSKTGLNLHKNFGKVPGYLVNAKASLEEKKRSEAVPVPRIVVPEGHRMLSEEERVETVELLEKRKDDVEAQIRKLPLRIETDSQKRRQNELNKRFTDIEQAIKFLAHPNVIIRDD